jgi:hypothetical protein
LAGTVNSQPGEANALTVNTGSGNISFDSAVGDITALGLLQANSSGTTQLNSTVNATTLTTDAGGETRLNGDVTTSGVQNYQDNLWLDNSITLTSNNAAINFAGTVDSESVKQMPSLSILVAAISTLMAQ